MLLAIRTRHFDNATPLMLLVAHHPSLGKTTLPVVLPCYRQTVLACSARDHCKEVITEYVRTHTHAYVRAAPNALWGVCFGTRRLTVLIVASRTPVQAVPTFSACCGVWFFSPSIPSCWDRSLRHHCFVRSWQITCYHCPTMPVASLAVHNPRYHKNTCSSSNDTWKATVGEDGRREGRGEGRGGGEKREKTERRRDRYTSNDKHND